MNKKLKEKEREITKLRANLDKKDYVIQDVLDEFAKFRAKH